LQPLIVWQVIRGIPVINSFIIIVDIGMINVRASPLSAGKNYGAIKFVAYKC